MHYDSYLRSAVSILEAYQGEEPFSTFIKKYFAAHRKHGSKDRKQITHFCYCYFRLGKAALSLTVEERIVTGLFLCSNEPNEALKAVRPGWNEKAALSPAEKLAMVNSQYSIGDVFPWKDQLSNDIIYDPFAESFFIQPDVFLRLRPDHEEWVRKKLNDSAIPYKDISNTSIAIPSSSKIDQVLKLDYEAMVQDLSSQEVGKFFEIAIANSLMPFIAAWDCCSASGGKSIMLFDLHENLDLVVSDIRESILHNLKKRFAEHEIRNYKAVIADLTKPLPKTIVNSKFHLIICDAPCTGSGTWSRTPEQLYFFEEKKIEEYASLQKRIVLNAARQLQKGGMFIYITCSVFKKENEEVIDFIQQNSLLELVKKELIKGYEKKADSMFAALFKLP